MTDLVPSIIPCFQSNWIQGGKLSCEAEQNVAVKWLISVTHIGHYGMVSKLINMYLVTKKWTYNFTNIK